MITHIERIVVQDTAGNQVYSSANTIPAIIAKRD